MSNNIKEISNFIPDDKIIGFGLQGLSLDILHFLFTASTYDINKYIHLLTDEQKILVSKAIAEAENKKQREEVEQRKIETSRMAEVIVLLGPLNSKKHQGMLEIADRQLQFIEATGEDHISMEDLVVRYLNLRLP